MRNAFEQQLRTLHGALQDMGSLIELAIRNATNALEKRDTVSAQKAIDLDREIDRTEREIESLCLKLLLHQQPVAGDMRMISAALKMVTDMERIGDQAADISEIVLYCRDAEMKHLEHLQQMAESAIAMVTDALDACARQDLDLIRRVIATDDVIDRLFVTVKNELIEVIRSDADAASQAVDLLMIAKYYERIGDHAQNIAEWAEYAVTGNHKGAMLT